jgi:intergrase/recombinase
LFLWRKLTPLYSAHEEWSSLSSIADIIEPTSRSREEFLEECKKGTFDKVKAAYRTFQSVAITGLIDEELIDVLPKSLKFIAHNGTAESSLASRKWRWIGKKVVEH